MKIIFFFYLILSTLSVIGFGFFLNNFLNLKNESSNLGLIGIFGLFLLSLISSFTHLFLSHSYTHNIIVLLVGICLFIFFIQKKKFDLKFIFTCFILLLSGFLIAKNNEDFPYYHLPNSLQFVEQKIQFGLGNLNHGFKHSSSIFLLNSIFYFPKTIYYLFNIPNFLFLVFSVYYFLSKIFEKKTKFINFSKIFCIFSGLILLTKFSRLAEYGTDIAGQILILIVILIASNMLIKKDISFENEKNEYLTILILIVFSISMKVYFMIYLVIPTYIFFKVRAKKKILRLIFDYKNFLILTTPIFFVIFFNFSATGCLVYPVSLTCFPDIFDWSLSINTVETLNSHYELWAKAGRGPNFEVDNTKSQADKDPGLHHFQLAHGNFEELFLRYDYLKARGIMPVQKWNHGVMTSFYYEDPDGNQAEMTCMNFLKEEDFRAYFETDTYKNNISGIPIDPDEYISRYRAGIPQEELVKIPS